MIDSWTVSLLFTKITASMPALRTKPFKRHAASNMILTARGAILIVLIVAAANSSHAQELFRRSGTHITVTTDLNKENQVSDLIASFDAAVPQWRRIWNLPPNALDQWHVQAFVIRDKATFEAQGLIPKAVPNFPFGYALQDKLFVMVQQSEYYTRHLLLHEGAHSLAFKAFGDTGPSWFMEGTAEMLSVHTGSGSNVKINQPPRDRESVPYWGRYSLMRKALKTPSLEAVLGFPRDLKSDVESYGWSWAAAMLLHNYPEYNQAFQKAARNGEARDAEFNLDLKRNLSKEWPVLEARWRLMCHELDYGFSWEHERVKLSVDDPVWDGSDRQVKVLANVGWQSIGVRLRAGTKIQIAPAGKCVLAHQLKPWVSEPAGVTIRYHRGRPLGQLLACLVSPTPDGATTLQPLPIAAITRVSTIPIRQDCWLLFRVNDANGEMSDNTGHYIVNMRRAK